MRRNSIKKVKWSLLPFATTFISLGASLPTNAQQCGPEAPCGIEGGSYHMRVPAGDGPHPVLIWYHGHRGNGASIHRSGGLERDFLDQGYVCLLYTSPSPRDS